VAGCSEQHLLLSARHEGQNPRHEHEAEDVEDHEGETGAEPAGKRGDDPDHSQDDENQLNFHRCT
jgi:hypothetical protein